MDILIFIQSINKFAIISFLITLVLIFIEIYLFIKEGKEKKLPQLPAFNQNLKTVFQQEKKENNKGIKKVSSKLRKPNLMILITLIFMLILISIIGIITRQNVDNSGQRQIIINRVSSQGINVYNRDWELLTESDLKNLKNGDLIYIGIKTISQDKDIDKARIKINKENWSEEDEVTNFNEKNGVFFKEYQITSEESKLVIEAELHSKREGWLEGK